MSLEASSGRVRMLAASLGFGAFFLFVVIDIILAINSSIFQSIWIRYPGCAFPSFSIPWPCSSLSARRGTGGYQDQYLE